ncbi:MAG: hypothetical protein KBT02_10650 [Treponema sp.]|nr:hypothetical protein [Candidatus Treponema caballi]
MKLKKLYRFIPVLFSLILITSCVTVADHSSVYDRLRTNGYEDARDTLEAEKTMLYSDRDQVLYDIDSGILSHFAGDWKQSNERLSDGERLIEYYYAKSISQSIMSWIENDTVKDYDGDDYEDIYTNLFMALNYIHMDEIEDAFVEIRRFDNKQKALSTRYAAELEEARASIRNNGASGNASYINNTLSFNNSALARYLSMLLYRSRGKSDDARIDYDQLLLAFQTQQQLYSFAVPASVQEELSVPKGKARLNILGFTGMAPVKQQEELRISNDLGTYFKLALPYMVPRGSSVKTVEVTVTGESGAVYKTSLERFESMEAIAMDTFGQKQSLIFAKTFARALAKSVTTSVAYMASDEFKKRNNQEMELLFDIIGFASQIHTEVSEQADLRTTQYFPAYANVGGITVEPGNYTVRVDFLNSRGKIISTEVFNDVTASEKGLNLVEAVCLQ